MHDLNNSWRVWMVFGMVRLSELLFLERLAARILTKIDKNDMF